MDSRLLIIGCGNSLRGDDAVGPILVQRLSLRGLPAHVRAIDGGTCGADVVLLMQDCPRVLLVDACRSGNAPGTVFEREAGALPAAAPSATISPHAFRWDHALALARAVLGAGYPRRVDVILVEGSQFELGAPLTPAVDAALTQLVDRLCAQLSQERGLFDVPGDSRTH